MTVYSVVWTAPSHTDLHTDSAKCQLPTLSTSRPVCPLRNKESIASPSPQPQSPGKSTRVTKRVKPMLKVVVDNPAWAPPTGSFGRRQTVKFGKSRKISPPQLAGKPRVVNSLRRSRSGNICLMKALARCFISSVNTPTVAPEMDPYSPNAPLCKQETVDSHRTHA